MQRGGGGKGNPTAGTPRQGRECSAGARAPQMEGFHPKGLDSDGVEGGFPRSDITLF